jgi:hypothetical protein
MWLRAELRLCIQSSDIPRQVCHIGVFRIAWTVHVRLLVRSACPPSIAAVIGM